MVLITQIPTNELTLVFMITETLKLNVVDIAGIIEWNHWSRK